MSTKFLLSPTENDLREKLGNEAITSLVTEERGADVLLFTENGSFGFQRKQVPHDFISSFTDGRMARAISLLKSTCTFCRVVGEGKFRYYPDRTVDMGRIRGGKRVPSRFTNKHVKGMINDIELVHGIQIDWTDDIDDTVLYLLCMRSFMAGKKHTGLFSRPSAKGAWYVPSSRDVELWLLQSFPGIGPATADAIIKRFGDRIPMKWTCTFEELLSVENITHAKAKTMWESLPMGTPVPDAVKGTKQATATGMNDLMSSFNSLRAKLRRPR